MIKRYGLVFLIALLQLASAVKLEAQESLRGIRLEYQSGCQEELAVGCGCVSAFWKNFQLVCLDGNRLRAE